MSNRRRGTAIRGASGISLRLWRGGGRHVRNNFVGYVALFLALTMAPAWAASIKPDSVESDHIVDGEVKMPDLADHAVNSAKVADGTLNTGDLADQSVTGEKVLDGSLTSFDVQNESLVGADIQDRTLVGPDVSFGAIGAEELGPILIVEKLIDLDFESTVEVGCSFGGELISGGYWTNQHDLHLFGNAPYVLPDGGRVWRVEANPGTSGILIGYALCLRDTSI